MPRLGLGVDDLRAEHAALAADRVSSPLLGLAAADLEVVAGWDDDIALILEERRAERVAHADGRAADLAVGVGPRAPRRRP